MFKSLYRKAARKLLYLMVRTNVLPNNIEDLNIDPSLPTFYVLSQKSYSDFLVMDCETEKLGFPSAAKKIKLTNGSETKYFSPTFAANIHGSIDKNAKFLPKNLKDFLEFFADAENITVQVVPVFIRWGLSPDKENSWFKVLFADAWIDPGKFRKLMMLFVHGRKTYVNFDKPFLFNSSDFTSENAVLKAGQIKNRFQEHFLNVEESMVGPDLSHRRSLFAEILSTEKVQSVVKQHAIEKNIKLEKSYAKADKYLNEIASDYSYPIIRFMDIVLERVWNQIYNGVNIEGLDNLRQHSTNYELVYVPCHRSHIDYLLLSYALFTNGFALPYIAAGINLNFPVVGSILRRCGAFFMRRSFKDDPLYATIFAEYLATIMNRGYPLEYFLEGGRSRTGRLLPPKLGMINMTVTAAAQSQEKEVAFVPIYIGYEKIVEMGSYIGELYGKKKQKETLGGLLGTAKRLKEDFGRVHLKFAEPILLNEFMQENLPEWQGAFTRQETNSDSAALQVGLVEKRSAIKKLGTSIVTNINNICDVNVTNMLALAILGEPNYVLDKKQLESQLNIFLDLLRQVQASVMPNVSLTDHSANEIIDLGKQLKVVSIETHVLGDIVRLDNSQILSMTYYRNNVLHLVATSAMLACIFVNSRRVSLDMAKSLCHWIYPFLKAELFLPWSEEEYDQVIDEHIKILLNLNLIEASGDYFQAARYETEEYHQLLAMSNLIHETFERYYIVLTLLGVFGSGELGEFELEGLARLTAQRLAILYSVNAPDYYDKTVIKGFLETLKNRNILYLNDEEKICFEFQPDITNKNASKVLGDSVRKQIDKIAFTEKDKLLAHLYENQKQAK